MVKISDVKAKLGSHHWSERAKGYELIDGITAGPNLNAETVKKLQIFIRPVLSETNPQGLTRALHTILNIVKAMDRIDSFSDSLAGEMAECLVQLILPSMRHTVREEASIILRELVEIGGQDQVIPLLVKNATNKTPRLSISCLQVLREIFFSFQYSFTSEEGEGLVVEDLADTWMVSILTSPNQEVREAACELLSTILQTTHHAGMIDKIHKLKVRKSIGDKLRKHVQDHPITPQPHLLTPKRGIVERKEVQSAPIPGRKEGGLVSRFSGEEELWSEERLMGMMRGEEGVYDEMIEVCMEPVDMERAMKGKGKAVERVVKGVYEGEGEVWTRCQYKLGMILGYLCKQMDPTMVNMVFPRLLSTLLTSIHHPNDKVRDTLHRLCSVLIESGFKMEGMVEVWKQLFSGYVNQPQYLLSWLEWIEHAVRVDGATFGKYKENWLGWLGGFKQGDPRVRERVARMVPGEGRKEGSRGKVMKEQMKGWIEEMERLEGEVRRLEGKVGRMEGKGGGNQLPSEAQLREMDKDALDALESELETYLLNIRRVKLAQLKPQ